MENVSCYMGLDIGGTKTHMILMRGDVIVSEQIVPSVSEPGQLLSLMQTFCHQSGIHKVDAIALGVPGRVNRDGTTVIDAPALGWCNLNLQEIIMQEFHCPCIVDNDTNIALLGEVINGAAVGLDNVALIAIGTGLGCAVMMDKHILYGAGGNVGEIGCCIFSAGQTDQLSNKAGTFGAGRKAIRQFPATKRIAPGYSDFRFTKRARSWSRRRS